MFTNALINVTEYTLLLTVCYVISSKRLFFHRLFRVAWVVFDTAELTMKLFPYRNSIFFNNTPDETLPTRYSKLMWLTAPLKWRREPFFLCLGCKCSVCLGSQRTLVSRSYSWFLAHRNFSCMSSLCSVIKIPHVTNLN